MKLADLSDFKRGQIVGARMACGNLLSFLLRCGTRPYESGTQ